MKSKPQPKVQGTKQKPTPKPAPKTAPKKPVDKAAKAPAGKAAKPAAKVPTKAPAKSAAPAKKLAAKPLPTKAPKAAKATKPAKAAAVAILDAPTPKTRQQILDDHRLIGELVGKIALATTAEDTALNLEQLVPLLHRHFREEEDEIGGLHAEIVRRTPQQHQALLDLKAEHARLLEDVQCLLAAAKSERPAKNLVQLGERLKNQLAAHEAKETELFLDSIWTDFGEGD